MKFWLLLSFFPTTWADCGQPPISIKLGNITVPNNQVVRGLDISVGTPHQSFAFLPQWPLNNTFVYGANGFCGTGSASACITYRGGQYDQFASESRGVPSPNSYPPENDPYPDFNWITDSLTLNSNITLSDFPIGIALEDWGAQGYHPQAAIGLGLNSTILNTLRSNDKISSRTWGMFWGRAGGSKNAQLDGNLVLGGYDRAKVVGQNHTETLAKFTSPCSTSMIVTITDIVLNFANGTDESLFNEGSTSMAACIEPDSPVLLTLPYDPYFINFKSLTSTSDFGRSFGIYYYAMTYKEGTQKYTGDLSIQLSTGLSIRIPNDQFVVPDLTIDNDTGSLIANSTEMVLALNSLQAGNSDDMPILGRQFLSSAYVMLNHEARKFTLWTANPTLTEDLVAVDSTNSAVETCPSTGAKSPTPQPPAPADTPSGSMTLSIKAIVGIAVGASVGIISFAIIAWIIVRRRRLSQKYQNTGHSTEQMYQPQAGKFIDPGPHEIYEPFPTAKVLPVELSATPRLPFK
ncbi:hypothetical protein FQN57_006058 [Myotisia sp. PD_48]|nr:hypothetical protein FQN57_006058 [Myotisia sp. PD_48]